MTILWGGKPSGKEAWKIQMSVSSFGFVSHRNRYMNERAVELLGPTF